jgi:hypothetical protein
MMRRIALVAALLLAALPAHAGYTLDGADDRIDIGTVGSFGSTMNDADGWSVMCWLNIPSQTSVASIMMNFTTGAQGAAGSFDQEFMFNIQTTWTTDFTSDANHVLVSTGDKNNFGIGWHQELGFTVAGTGLHHYALTAITNGASGANNNSGAPVVWYADGGANNTWTKAFSDGMGTLVNFSNTLAIGAERKNGGTWFDWTAGTFADCRAYSVALTAQEVTDIYKMRGRDSVSRGLLRRWPLQAACIETVKNDTCTPQNGPTVTTVNELYGVRRR